jgi:hypothetical protein
VVRTVRASTKGLEGQETDDVSTTVDRFSGRSGLRRVHGGDGSRLGCVAEGRDGLRVLRDVLCVLSLHLRRFGEGRDGLRVLRDVLCVLSLHLRRFGEGRQGV